jgi:chitodextrinase
VTVTTPALLPGGPGGPSLPSTPGSLSAQPGTNPGRIDLQWQPSTGGEGVVSYEVARDGAVLATVAGTSYGDTAVASVTTYAYAVTAVDAAGTRSAPATVTATASDLSAPSAVAALAGSGSDGPPRVTLTWQASVDDVGVAAYDVFRDGTPFGSTAGTSFVDSSVSAGRSFTYSVQARDATGNVGPATDAVVTVPDATAPSVPPKPKATALSKPLRVSLTWNGSSDNVGVTGYRVYRNGTLVATVATRTWVDSGVRSRTRYTYEVAAVDAAGNASRRSPAVSVTTPKS